MNPKKISLLFLTMAMLFFLAACQAVTTTPQPDNQPQSSEQVAVNHTAQKSTVEEAVIDESLPLSAPTAPAVIGYALFDPAESIFKGFHADHSLAFQAPAPGLTFPSPNTVDVVDGAVYYMQDLDKQLFRSTAEGVAKVNIPKENLSAFAVSADEQWIAWAITNWGNTSVESSIWVAGLDESHNPIEPRKVVTYSSEQSEAFNLIPIEWTSEDILIFDRFISGIGGYILFGGHNSLYTYDPTSGQISTVIPAEEMHGLCLDSYRLDLDKVIFSCGEEGLAMTVRSLTEYSDTRLPAISEYPAAGSAHYSPSGSWLAYAAAHYNYEDEAGIVLVMPANLNQEPLKIAEAADNHYINVLGWLDEETLLYSVNQWPQSNIWSIKRDGSEQQELHSSQFFLGWIR